MYLENSVRMKDKSTQNTKKEKDWKKEGKEIVLKKRMRGKK
jgi:hypothetical protein